MLIAADTMAADHCAANASGQRVERTNELGTGMGGLWRDI